ncbi:12240_t:CDS:2, partial [Entrophospora sp. SA101]
MPRPTKSKSSYKNQIRNPDGTFYSRKLNKGKEIESTLGNVAELDNDNFLGEVLENEVELGEDNFSEVLENEEIILVTHDECIFYSNDGKRGIWAKSGELPLKKKGNGRSIMVSEFLTEKNGRLHLNEVQITSNPYVPEESRVILKPGKNHEGYWTNDHLIEQVEFKAIPIFEALFSNCTALFAFDNSTNHGYKSDALVASRMNLNPGGKQPKMKDTVFGPNNIFQSMVFEDGIPKGMKQVLVERNLWKEGLLADCKLCRGKVVDE